MSRWQRIGWVAAGVVCMTSALVVAAGSRPAAVPVGVTALRTEYLENPVGIDAQSPRFSWRLVSERRGVSQSAYRVLVATSPDGLIKKRGHVWDSGRVLSAQSTQVAYDGQPLRSGQRYYWTVQLWDETGTPATPTPAASFEMGLLVPSDWKAQWIEPGLPDNPAVSGPSPLLRREFSLEGTVRSARAYVTSRGLYELYLNGTRVGDAVLTPGWTAYDSRLQYQTYDVTALLRPGANAVGMHLGNGWYRGDLAWDGHRNIYGKTLAALVQIRVRYTNGRETLITSDTNWRASTGSVLMSEIYHGETQDARQDPGAWATPGYDAASWSPVVLSTDTRTSHLVAPTGPPMRRIQEIKPARIFKTPAGDTVVDMGQNMVGWVRLTATGPAGTTITLRHAEVLDKAGNVYLENLRKAKATARYTLAGTAREVFEPHFTFFGFRYVAISGYPGDVTPESVTGIVVHSDMPVTGQFTSSNPEINQLQHNILWGQKGNFVDVPTDCPQRDERLGWTGDAQVFARTASFNMDVAGFFTKWLRDLAADQWSDGRVPHVVPNVLGKGPGSLPGGSAAWGDAAVIIPWTMYLTYGDRRLLAEQYPSMTRWVDFQRARAGDDLVWDGDAHFGDWLAFASTDSSYPGATTGKDLIATAFLAYSSDLVARAAAVLGKADDAARYRAQFESVSKAFLREFVSPGGRVGENTQTAYVLALHFDLLPEAQRAQAAARLVREVTTRGHLTTGFVGTPYLCHVLARYGYLNEAYALLTRRTYPSWLYPVTQGATTIWERWDGQRPDGSFQDPGMNSFNHYAYGAIGDWMYSVVAGLDLDPADPGFHHAVIAPQPGADFTHASATHETPYGTLSSGWTRAHGVFTLTVRVPPNARATVTIPDAQVGRVTEGGQPLVVGPGITSITQNGSHVVIEIGSGSYVFARRES